MKFFDLTKEIDYGFDVLGFEDEEFYWQCWFEGKVLYA